MSDKPGVKDAYASKKTGDVTMYLHGHRDAVSITEDLMKVLGAKDCP